MTKTSTGLAKQASHGKKPQQSEPVSARLPGMTSGQNNRNTGPALQTMVPTPGTIPRAVTATNDDGPPPIPDFTTPVPTTAVVTPRTDNPPPALPRVLQSELNEADLVLEGVALGMEPSAFVTRNYESLTSLLATETRRRSSRDLQSRLNFGLDNDITRDSEEESRTRKRFKQRRRLTDQHKRPPVFDRLGNRIPGPQLEEQHNQGPRDQELETYKNQNRRISVHDRLGATQEIQQHQSGKSRTPPRRHRRSPSGSSPSSSSSSDHPRRREGSDSSEQDSSDGGDRNPRHQKSRRTNNSEEDMSLPWHRQKADAFVKRIKNYLDNIKRRLPSHVKTYEGTGDPHDHLKIFETVTTNENWPQAIWCRQFNSTLVENARTWFDKLPKQTTTDAFMQRYKDEMVHVKSCPEILQISGFMNGISNQDLIKKLNDKVPSTFDEAMKRTRSFIQGETAAADSRRGYSNYKSNDQPKRQSQDNYNNHNNHYRGQRGARSDDRIRPDKQSNKKDVLKDKHNTIYMARTDTAAAKYMTKQKFCQEEVISFPIIEKHKATSSPLVISTHIEGQRISEVYVDGGSSTEIIYEHCFNQLPAATKEQMTPPIQPITSFSGEAIWPLGQIKLQITIGDMEHATTSWMTFLVVRSHSPYNAILRRPGLAAINAVPSIAHGAIKFPVVGGIVTIYTTTAQVVRKSPAKRARPFPSGVDKFLSMKWQN
ncbi:hypothetical protein Tco_1578216 [Tanacetum coccineum]